MFPVDLGVNWEEVKVTVMFNTDCQYADLVQSMNRVWKLGLCDCGFS